MTQTFRQKVWLVALVLQSSLLFSTATVSGNLKDLTGANVSTRTLVRFRLAGCSYQAKASGVALVTPYEKDFTPAADGSIAGTIYRNDTEISCLDQLDTTWYEVTVYRDGKAQKPTPYRVAAATVNLNMAAPMTTTNVSAAREAVVVNPTALQTINTHPLAFGTGSGISANYQGSLRATGTYLRSDGSLFFAPVSISQVASDIVSSPNLNGVAYWNSSVLSTTPTGGAGTLCLVSTDGGVPGFSSCAGSASTAWSALSAPSANLTLSMGANTTQLNWDANTGATTLFRLRDAIGNVGTGFLLDVSSNTSSTASPVTIRVHNAPTFEVATNGVGNNGVIRMGNFPFTATPLTVTLDSGTGPDTEMWKTVKPLIGSSVLLAKIGTTADTIGRFLGICVRNCGLISTLQDLAIGGYTRCVFDNATSAGNWVTMSTTANGQCHDAGAAFPTAALNGQTVIGRVAESGTAGTRMILLAPQESQADVSRLTTSVFLPGTLTGAWTGATITLPSGIRLMRVEAQAKTAPVGCTTNAVVRVGDNASNNQDLTITAAGNDSGGILRDFSVGTTLVITVQTAAAGCGINPADVNVVVQYRML